MSVSKEILGRYLEGLLAVREDGQEKTGVMAMLLRNFSVCSYLSSFISIKQLGDRIQQRSTFEFLTQGDFFP